jgi:hypothetical protein
MLCDAGTAIKRMEALRFSLKIDAEIPDDSQDAADRSSLLGTL